MAALKKKIESVSRCGCCGQGLALCTMRRGWLGESTQSVRSGKNRGAGSIRPWGRIRGSSLVPFLVQYVKSSGMVTGSSGTVPAQVSLLDSGEDTSKAIRGLEEMQILALG